MVTSSSRTLVLRCVLEHRSLYPVFKHVRTPAFDEQKALSLLCNGIDALVGNTWIEGIRIRPSMHPVSSDCSRRQSNSIHSNVASKWKIARFLSRLIALAAKVVDQKTKARGISVPESSWGTVGVVQYCNYAFNAPTH